MEPQKKVYTATFMIRVKSYDEEFHIFNNKIIEVAESNPGYLGRESWNDGDRNIVILYWSDLNHLRDFSNDPDHLAAKKRYQEWYGGYQVLISEVLRSYGDQQYNGSYNV